MLKHPNAKLDAEVLIALQNGRVSIAAYGSHSAHAAIDESVELTKQAGHRFASGMVNAVLRKMAKNASERGSQRLACGVGAGRGASGMDG